MESLLLSVVIHFHAVDSVLEFVQKWLEPGLENATVLISHTHEYWAFQLGNMTINWIGTPEDNVNKESQVEK